MAQNRPYPTGHIKAKLMTEDGKPMEKFNLYAATGFSRVNFVTDANGWGEFTASTDSHITINAELDGYYESLIFCRFDEIVAGKWEPWGQEKKLILRKVKKPVPMFAVHKYEIEMPLAGKMGYDLELLDWEYPFGKGKHSDLIFTLKRRGTETKGEASLKLSFSQPGDGVVPLYEYVPGGSQFRFPRMAPEKGYLPERQWSHIWNHGNSLEEEKLSEQYHEQLQKRLEESPPPVAYVFRVRTVLDKKGKVVSALYGKMDVAPPVYQNRMRGDLEWDPEFSRTTKILLTFWLNPDGTRNLEYDPKKNLFKDVDRMFWPRLP